MIRIHIGNPVKGSDFFGRERELARVLEDLQTANLLLLAPRRVGKTSLLLRLAEIAEPRAGFDMVYTSVEDLRDEAGFVDRLYRTVLTARAGSSVLETLKANPLAQALKKVKPKELRAGPLTLDLGVESAGWREAGDALEYALRGLEQPLVIALDELPVLILKLLDQDVARTRDFLNWFRAIRQKNPEVHWILAGSIGLDTVAQLHNLQSTINDLTILDLPEFDPETASAFLQELGFTYSIALSQEVRDAIIERIGWSIPYFLQLVFKEIRDLGEVPVTPATVERAIGRLVESRRRGYFENWYQRLEEQLGPVRALWAERLLTVAAGPEGASVDSLKLALNDLISDLHERKKALDFTLWVLVNDGYLVRVGERVRFRSPLLRGWWATYHAG